MRTSYFARWKDKPGGISIALGTPPWFTGPTYRQLNPTWDMLSKYRLDHDVSTYLHSYYSQILDRLDPEQVYNDLNGKVLLCWEKPGCFCHRHIVRDWIWETINITIFEI